MIILSRRKPPLTREQRDEIEATEPLDYRAYFWLGARGRWTCQIYPPVKTWGSGPFVSQARHLIPMDAFRSAYATGSIPRELVEWRGCLVEVA